MRSLDADRFRGSLFGIAIGVFLFLAWVAWFFVADVALYEVTDIARIEVDREPHAVMSMVTARVLRNHMELDREVAESEVLLELDGDEVRFELEEKRAEMAGLKVQLEQLEREIRAQRDALGRAEDATGSALAEARARHAEAVESARFAELESARLASLRDEGLVSQAAAEAAETEARVRSKGAEALEQSVARHASDRRFDQSEKQAELLALERNAAEIDSALRGLAAVERRLERELSLHVVRAPVAGRVGDRARLRVGEVVEAGRHLGTVIPTGEMRVVAEYLPHRVLGRIREGQKAKLRLTGFSWVQYGSVAASVLRVGSEPSNGRVRVELAVEHAGSFPVTLGHGLPGTLEVEVERISPAALVLRAAGRVVSRSTAEHR